MLFDVSKILGGVTFVAILCLTILAYRGWTGGLRQTLPHWRSALGVTSIALTFLCWSILAILFLADRSGVNSHFSSDWWITAMTLLALLGTCLAFALRGAPRIAAIAAGLLMFAGVTNVVH
jgi:cytochrome bd-type quinol oxidase subunit 2